MRFLFILIILFSVVACKSTNPASVISKQRGEFNFVETSCMNMKHTIGISEANKRMIAGASNGQAIPEFKRYSSLLSTISEDFASLGKRCDTFIDRAHKIQPTWYKARGMTLQDQNWAKVEAYDQDSTQEYSFIVEKMQGYSGKLTELQALLKSPNIARLNLRFPTNIEHANLILSRYELTDNVIAFNKAIITQVDSLSRRHAKDLEKLAELANIEQFALTLKRSHSPLPRRTNASSESIYKAKQAFVKNVSPHITQAAIDFAEQQTDIFKTFTILQPIQNGKFKLLSTLLPHEDVIKVNNVFLQRNEALYSEIVIKDKKVLPAALNGLRSNRQILSKLNLHQNEFTKKWSRYLSELHKQRLTVLGNLQSEFISAIEGATNLNDLNDVIGDSIHPFDEVGEIIKQLRQKQYAKFLKLSSYQVASSRAELSINNFDTRDLNFDFDFMAIYLGDFKHVRLEQNGETAIQVLAKYMDAYSKRCDSVLPQDKVQITKGVCETKKVTRDGWGNVIDEVCVQYRRVPTGFFSKPSVYETLEGLVQRTGNNVPGGSFISNASKITDKVGLGSELDMLISRHNCNNPALIQFEDNLLRYISTSPANKISSDEKMDDYQLNRQVKFPVRTINFEKFLDTIVTNDSAFWGVNEYKPNSISDIAFHPKNVDSVTEVVYAKFDYKISPFNSPKGGVRVIFKNNIPTCIKFSDSGHKCFKPSRKLVKMYEQGYFLN
jgi:hypothetical protein